MYLWCWQSWTSVTSQYKKTLLTCSSFSHNNPISYLMWFYDFSKSSESFRQHDIRWISYRKLLFVLWFIQTASDDLIVTLPTCLIVFHVAAPQLHAHPDVQWADAGGCSVDVRVMFVPSGPQTCGAAPLSGCWRWTAADACSYLQWDESETENRPTNQHQSHRQTAICSWRYEPQ